MWEAIFAACRISLWFILLFGFIGPLFLDHTKTLNDIEKLIYSWVGLGGIIIFSVFVLTTLHFYDFISLVLTLLLIPLIRNIWRSNKTPLDYFRQFELRSVIYQVKFIETFDITKWKRWKNKIENPAEEASGFKITRTILVFIIALVGGATRIYPALMSAAPFSRNWYFELSRVKNLRLQDYFSNNPEPAGMHSLVSVFSMLTQVSPEMILHLLGALSSFFLCILIYWTVRDITRNEVPMAPVLAMSVYAVTPLLVMPLSLDLQIEANSLDLALCFALPTLTIFMRNLRASYKSPWFYVFSGLIATGMTNLFVAFVILLPLMLVGLATLPRRQYWKSFFKVFWYLVTVSVVILAPIVIYNYLAGINQYTFFIERFLNTQVYIYNPLLILPIEELSILYLGIAGILSVGYLIEIWSDSEHRMRDELIFLIVLSVVAVFFSPYIHTIASWFDAEQLGNFYSILIAMLIGILFASILRWSNNILKLSKNTFRFAGLGLFGLILGGALYFQNGLHVSRQLPSTIPDGFYESYYNIIGTYLPYSYATVGPEIERITAKNRHYFMNYRYFLDEYGAIDSLYKQQLSVVETEESLEQIPPASIFIFVEKPPYDAIQQGILYDSPTVMRDIEQWLTTFKQLEGRSVKTYFENEQAIVYQIINRPDESYIGGILWHVYPRDKNE